MLHLAIDNPDNRRTAAYSKEERALIDIHKDDYIAAPNSDQRKAIVLTRIYEALAAYWKGRGEQFDASSRKNDLLAWIRNAWRKVKVTSEVKPKTVLLNVRKSDVVGKTMKKEINEEIDKLLGPTDAQDQKKRFGACSTAIGNIIERMSPEDTAKLEDEVTRTAQKGYSEDVRRELVEKHYVNRLDTSAKLNWLELGMLSVTFTAFEDMSGRLVVETHDRIAELLGLTDPDIKSFEETYPEKVHGLQMVVLEYVRDMFTHYRGGGAKPETKENILGKDENGYPRLFPHYRKEGILKETAEKLYRDYLSCQYFLATGRRSDQAPYTQMIQNINGFVDKKYFPPDFEFKDPHNTRLSPILEFLDYIADREQHLPATEVFRFYQVKASRKGGELEPSCYPDEFDRETNPGVKPARKRNNMASKKQAKFVQWIPDTLSTDTTVESKSTKDSAPTTPKLSSQAIPSASNWLSADNHSSMVNHTISASLPPPSNSPGPSGPKALPPNTQASMHQNLDPTNLYEHFSRIGTFDFFIDQSNTENMGVGGSMTTDVSWNPDTADGDTSQFSYTFQAQPSNARLTNHAQYMDASAPATHNVDHTMLSSHEVDAWNAETIRLARQNANCEIGLATASNSSTHDITMANYLERANTLGLATGAIERASHPRPFDDILAKHQALSLAAPGSTNPGQNAEMPPHVQSVATNAHSESTLASGTANARIWPRPRPRIPIPQHISPAKVLRDTIQNMPLVGAAEQVPINSITLARPPNNPCNNTPAAEQAPIDQSTFARPPNMLPSVNSFDNTSTVSDASSGARGSKLARSKGVKRPLTSDDLAAMEADNLKVVGKRVSKQKIRD